MKQRGGARKGAGRKRISSDDRIIRARVAPEHESALMLAGGGSISVGIRRLAEKHWKLIHGDKDDRPKQGNSIFDRYITKVRPEQSNQNISGGGEEKPKSPINEGQP
jgi:hypothetical protein